MTHEKAPYKIRSTELDLLRRLDEPGAFLLIARGAEKAGVFSVKNSLKRPVCMTPRTVAEKLINRDWVVLDKRGELSVKYKLGPVGRAALARSTQPAPEPTNGFAERPSEFAYQHQSCGERRFANPRTGEIETMRVNLGESPLGWLSRRKGADGKPLISADEVEAGERLREDFELAQIGPKMGQDWRRFLTPGARSAGAGRTPSEGPMFARERVTKAVEVLGPGLSDAAIRVCCFLEGLEATERRMGWSARSGKVVLKLALQRLVSHYGLTAGVREVA